MALKTVPENILHTRKAAETAQSSKEASAGVLKATDIRTGSRLEFGVWKALCIHSTQHAPLSRLESGVFSFRL